MSRKVKEKKAPEKKKRGRPTNYTPELGKEICKAISNSKTGIRKLCEKHPHWPNPDTIFEWRMEHKEFSEQYAQAKMNQAELLVDEIFEIADDTSNDDIADDNGGYRANTEWINRSRLRVDTRKWFAAKVIPKIYGDKIQAEHTGKDGEPIKLDVTVEQAITGIGEILDAARSRAAQDLCEEDPGSE